MLVRIGGAPAPTREQPATNATAFQRTIRANVTGFNLNVDVVCGAAPVTVTIGQTAIVGFDATGAFRVIAVSGAISGRAVGHAAA